MIKIIGVYNNKGGVGKTTLTLFFSDFLSSISVNKQKSRILVIDFDIQNSCANAILGLETVTDAKSQGLTLPHALMQQLEANKNGSKSVDLSPYIFTRKENTKHRTKKKKLGDVDVIVSHPEVALEFEEASDLNDSLLLAQWMKKELSKKYDFIFVDLPGNISKRNGFSLIGAFLAEYFIVPIEPNRINTNAMPATINMLKNIKQWKGKGKSELLGFILNRADKRTSQYKRHKDEIMQFANLGGGKVYKNILPPTPKLSNASDDSIEFFTLADRYDTYYQNVRAIVVEVAQDLGFKAKKKDAPDKG